MYRKLYVSVLLALIAGVLLLSVASVTALEEEDPSIFLIVTDGQGQYVGGNGWYAGFVVRGSGTYTLQIFGTGGEYSGLWPVTNVHIVVAISVEAHSGGLESLAINGVSITGFNAGQDPNWPRGPGHSIGGPFSEEDYYGYNDSYIIPGGLTLTNGTRINPKILTIDISFSSSATMASKVALLAYGTDNKCRPAKTPYSGGVTFVVPELAVSLLTLAPFAAFGVYKLRRKQS